MTEMFDKSRANFSRMTERDKVYVSDIIQQTFLVVEEFKVEAAATSVVSIARKSSPPEMKFNRPFFFVVKDNISGIILFMGKFHKP